MHSFLQDIRYSYRQLRNHPGFALTAILSLALGIGATVAVFSVIWGVLLHPFPYANVERLGNLSMGDSSGNIWDVGVTGPQLREIQKLHSIEGVATWTEWSLTVTGHDAPEDVVAFYGVGSTFPTLGVPALLGRNIGPSDARDGQEPQPVVLLHYRFWQRHFNGDPTVIGKTLELAHKKYTIIGVTRPNFTWGWGADVYLPEVLNNDPSHTVGVVLRVSPGTTWSALNAELQPLFDRFAKETPTHFAPNFHIHTRSLTAETQQNMGGMLYLLFAAVALLLLIGCGNVSILLLARGTARQHEFAVRAAVGASGYRLVRQLLTESLMLALTGAGLGILLAYQLLGLIIAWMPKNLYPPDVAISINLPVFLFSAGIAILTGIFFGLFPALQMAKPEVSQVMQSGTKKVAGSSHSRRTHNLLIGTQIALTLLLMTAAGAAIEGFVRMMRVPLGYDPHNVISVGIPVHNNTYTTWESRSNYFEQLRSKIAELPDVVSTGISTNATPPDNGWEQRFELLGKPSASPEAQVARMNFVDPGYFDTLHIGLREGRTWSASEISRGASLVLINETLARRYFPNEDAVGHALKVSAFKNEPPYTLAAPGADGWLQIIGVVKDTLDQGLDKPVEPAVYTPYNTLLWMHTQILVNSRVAPETLLHSIRQQLVAVNPDQQVGGNVNNLETWIKKEPEYARGRLISALFGAFSILALILSAVGLYSVASYSVAQRTSEFGIRMALGARKSDVLKIVLSSAAVSVGIGIGVGLSLSFGLGRLIGRWVENSSGNPLLVLAASLLLLAVSVIACLAPARRASSVDPMTALRCE